MDKYPLTKDTRFTAIITTGRITANNLPRMPKPFLDLVLLALELGFFVFAILRFPFLRVITPTRETYCHYTLRSPYGRQSFVNILLFFNIFLKIKRHYANAQCLKQQLVLFYALTILPKSAFKEAPPIKPPSMFGLLRSSAALPAFIDPPYWIRTASAVAPS